MNWHDYFTYNAETGELIWKERKRSDFNSAQSYSTFKVKCMNKAAGAKAYTVRKNRLGIKTKIFGKQLYAHRIIWEMHHGKIPNNIYIDHINGDPWDNRLDNLRLASPAENVRNSKRSVNNTSGFKGVQSSGNKWKASIVVNGKYICIGTFLNKHDAAMAYNEAAKKLFGEFARFQ